MAVVQQVHSTSMTPLELVSPCKQALGHTSGVSAPRRGVPEKRRIWEFLLDGSLRPMYSAIKHPMRGLHTTGGSRAVQGHKIKNPKSEIYKALRTIPVGCRVILTGTPIQNNLMEAHSLFDFACKVRPGALACPPLPSPEN